MTPRVVARAVRLVVVAATAAGALYWSNRYAIVSIPEGPTGMEPAFPGGRRVLVDRRPGEIRRREIVLYEDAPGGVCLARVLALEGDSVEAVAGWIRVNGLPARRLRSDSEIGEGAVPPGSLFVAPDDVGALGPGGAPWILVALSEIRGRVVLLWAFG